MSKIGIIDADLLDNGTRHPNLALMKISGYYKAKGDTVELLTSYDCIKEYDKVFLSCVFSFTNIPINLKAYPNLVTGGSGLYWDQAAPLPDEIEHHMPDYDLYKEYIETAVANGKKESYFDDYLNYSIGFTTRGCVRRCAFCINHNKTKVQLHSPIEEFYDPARKYIYLWDDNFLAYPGWKEILQQLMDTKRGFQFRQGLDMRLVNDEKAEMLSRCKYRGDYIFAFDNIEDKEVIEKKLTLWRKYIKKTTKLYVFCAFDRNEKWDEEFWKQDIIDIFKRIKIIMKYGCLPYIMRYERYKDSPYRGLYITIARWCNQPQFYKKKTFKEFCIVNQEYHKTKDTYCAAYKSMLEFEEKYPEIAGEYFNLSFEQENQYK